MTKGPRAVTALFSRGGGAAVMAAGRQAGGQVQVRRLGPFSNCGHARAAGAPRAGCSQCAPCTDGVNKAWKGAAAVLALGNPAVRGHPHRAWGWTSFHGPLTAASHRSHQARAGRRPYRPRSVGASMMPSRRLKSSSPPRRHRRARGAADVVACTVWSLVVWGACLAATLVVNGPGGRPSLAAALTLLPGAVAASWAAHAQTQAGDAGAGPARAYLGVDPTGRAGTLGAGRATGALYRALAAAAGVLVVGGPVRFATAGTEEGAVTASLVHLPLHAVVAMVV